MEAVKKNWENRDSTRHPSFRTLKDMVTILILGVSTHTHARAPTRNFIAIMKSEKVMSATIDLSKAEGQNGTWFAMPKGRGQRPGASNPKQAGDPCPRGGTVTVQKMTPGKPRATRPTRMAHGGRGRTGQGPAHHNRKRRACDS
jgi:hypothetical protein